MIDDILASDQTDAIKAVVSGEGIAALAFIPVVEHGGVIGKFMAYHDAPHAFSADEIELALTIARQLGFAIERTRDAANRKLAEEQRSLLINELNHRVKNTLATVQSLAMQTLRSTERSKDARALFDSRLSALSRAHDLLTAQNWEGAGLREVLARALGPFRTDERRVVMMGPDVRISPKQALALSIAMHELATNAAKYGALSNPNGNVELIWSVARARGGEELRVIWTETGGPAVAPPARTGFGTRLIEQGLKHELGGAARIDYRPGGVVCVMHSPLRTGDGT
jgi:two-component sensor histidine kinase